jgi:uncharacterized repeat protein (TIGR03803 family)
LTSVATGVLTKGNGSMIYGTTENHIFSFNTSTKNYSVRYTFSASTGNIPKSGLTLGADNKFYGTTSAGGANSKGVIYRFDTLTNAYTKLLDFPSSQGASDWGLTVGTGNLLYGTTYGGTANSAGILYSFNPVSLTFQDLYHFSTDTGGEPNKRLTSGNDGKLYGVANTGPEVQGCIFSYDPTTDVYTIIKIGDPVDADNSSHFISSLTLGIDGKLYGINSGGHHATGFIYSYDPTTQTFTGLHHFDAAPEKPNGKLIQASNGKFYAASVPNTLSDEGLGQGEIFSFEPSLNTVEYLFNFSTPVNGAQPYNSLVKGSAEELFGMTSAGGNFNQGVIFSFNPVTNVYKKLFDFSSGNGIKPRGNLTLGTDGKFYGMTYQGGAFNRGVLFSFDITSHVYTKLYDFDLTNGANPEGSLFLNDNGIFYGMTTEGGTNEIGVVFSFNPSTNIFTRLHDFSSVEGAYPHGNFIKGPNGKLYALATFRAANMFGSIVSYDISSNIFSKVYDFNNTEDGAFPYSNLLLASNGILYGMTSEGGSLESGTIFSFDPNSNIVTKLYSGGASGSFVEDAGKLYGMNDSGVFAFDLATNTYSHLQYFDGTNGAAPRYGALLKVGNTATVATKYIKVTLYGGINPYNNSEWNNWNSYSLSSGNLKYSDGSSSSVSAAISQQSGIADNGPSYNSTMAPVEVMRYASYSTATRTLTISGLDNSKTYNLELYASRNGATNNTTRFTIGSTSIDILTDNNLSNKASFVSTVPSGGKITVNISKLNAYNYLNGFVITENGVSSSITRKEQIGFQEQNLSTSISTYPNPATDRIVLSINNNYTGQMKVEIIDLKGSVVKQFKLSKTYNGISHNSLPVGDLRRGEYLIRIQTGSQVEVRKLLKL